MSRDHQSPPPEIPPPDPVPPRRLPAMPLPAYRFVPGLQPHPMKHPDGHMAHAPPTRTWNPECPWAEDVDYLLGCDLFDHRYLWEAHEAWEGVWHQVPRGDIYRELLQGLIQAAAGVLKAHVQQAQGAARLHVRSRGRLMEVQRRTGLVYRGLQLPQFIDRLDAFHSGGDWPTMPMEDPG